MKKNILYSLFTVSVLWLLNGCHSTATDKNQTAGINKNAVGAVEGIVVQRSSIEQTIQTSGSLTAFDETVLMPEISGRVTAVNLPEGQFVRKGTLLVKIFDGDLQAQLQKLQIQLKIAEATEVRQKQLLDINGISRLDYDQSSLQVSNLKADIEVIKVQIDKTQMLAPFDGKIGLKKISLGAYISPTIPVATIRAEQQLKLDFSVPEKYSNEMKAGKKVSFTINGDDRTYEATVLANEENIDNSTRNLKVRAIVASNSTNLVPGAFAEVTVLLGQNNKALMIPTQAIIPMARDKKVIVARNGKAKFVPIKTGTREESTIEVLDGIVAGDTVITTGILFIRPDAPLKFSKVN